MSAEDESRLIRAGVGYTLAHDGTALGRLSRNYGPFVAGAKSANALRIALDTNDGGPRNFAALTASADTFTGWVNGMKAQFRQRTGGNRPATPARP